jgi:hypothetical protein
LTLANKSDKVFAARRGLVVANSAMTHQKHFRSSKCYTVAVYGRHRSHSTSR